MPLRVAQRLVVDSHRQRAATHGPRVHDIDDVAATRLWVDRLAYQMEAAHLHGVAGLLEHLPGTRLEHRFAGVEPAAGDKPVRAAALLMTDEQYLPIAPDEHPDADPDRAIAHPGIIGPIGTGGRRRIETQARSWCLTRTSVP